MVGPQIGACVLPQWGGVYYNRGTSVLSAAMPVPSLIDGIAYLTAALQALLQLGQFEPRQV